MATSHRRCILKPLRIFNLRGKATQLGIVQSELLGSKIDRIVRCMMALEPWRTLKVQVYDKRRVQSLFRGDPLIGDA